ncbi:MAG: tRNA guanosine(34) transglycosylase Tgt [Planctomycetota bacterium]|nr:tRNA guanosine(34) transglycosylase Tgt [Planctomycetota bacterium]
MALSFSILATASENGARLGRVETPHGGFDTPAFMPVATAAAMKCLTVEQVEATGSQIILNNAYHLMLRPGADRIARLGGTHRFMRWDKPILTDSGGYQAFSMSDINSVDEHGVTFRSFVDGSRITLTPERSIEVQNQIGADIIMAFDDCPPSREEDCVNPEKRVKLSGMTYEQRLEASNDRTARWLERCIAAHGRPQDQALFGIVQGGTSEKLRTRSVEQVCAHDLPGYAIGGVAVGEGPEQIHRTVRFTAGLLPVEKPRYLMGVGYERDIVRAVASGVDMFDCVLPTRNGRKAYAFTRTGPLKLKNARFAEDLAPIEPGCPCPTCAQGFSRAYLRHLFMADEWLGQTLVSQHNLWHYQALLLDIRRSIRDDSWSSLLEAWPVVQPADEPIDTLPGS